MNRRWKDYRRAGGKACCPCRGPKLLQLAAANRRVDGVIGHERSRPRIEGTSRPTRLLLELQELKGEWQLPEDREGKDRQGEKGEKDVERGRRERERERREEEQKQE